MRIFTALMIFALGIPVARSAEKEAGGKPKNSPAIQQFYQDALGLYAHENYREAIIKWTAILKEDPDQVTAQTMILDARKRLAFLTKKRREATFTCIAEGRYRDSLHELQSLLDQDPGDPELERMQRRLENIIRLSPRIAPKTKGARAAVLGLKGYLSLPPDLKLAHNALRYANEIAPQEDLYKKAMGLVYGDFPSLAGSDAVTPGMKLLEYKHYVAIHQIYDAKYHLAVITLTEILELEPDDLMALKQLGSANYSLGRMEEARAAWIAALKLSPGDKTLEHFLAKIKKYKSSAAKP